MIEQIIEAVSTVTGVSYEAMQSPSRKREIVEARSIAQWFIRENTTLSLKEIGGCFGGRDHSTALTAINKISDWLLTDRKLQQKFFECQKRIDQIQDIAELDELSQSLLMIGGAVPHLQCKWMDMHKRYLQGVSVRDLSRVHDINPETIWMNWRKLNLPTFGKFA
jgi:hypothetical protein